ncbi:hypothetical protein VaNZ11_012010 [Volvox africanus]|uniref:Secreted protein n=1 Tax=Volvox africanus TaxID=51714 RepID=A0ABQ5SAB5_9CHLO|nr:hypothetical protein VaNZ11_006076 [Volvox africanus]GLI66428.1 hypothetical protein VaNZ11_010201 [Volvox africanus]GLI66483.1 hypothetical protein VaNZ11_010282 [Volvox africanus]GLI66488.1 hypothetical protein VaNZ11_010287 [Volvox africanus]GLI66838.1 hypothetical protein VaNZ11_010793 [Volvox africanus]
MCMHCNLSSLTRWHLGRLAWLFMALTTTGPAPAVCSLVSQGGSHYFGGRYGPRYDDDDDVIPRSGSDRRSGRFGALLEPLKRQGGLADPHEHFEETEGDTSNKAYRKPRIGIRPMAHDAE